MSNTPKDLPVGKTPVDPKWGETAPDHLGYASEEERIRKRGLEDWEMVERMDQTSDHKIPYWFIGLFLVLLLVATGLTFPFWGVRPGYERPWFDWGIVAGATWVVVMGALIYYIVDYRKVRADKKEKAAKQHQGAASAAKSGQETAPEDTP
ncbi:MAG TPA: hypothetical protein ENJ19_02575 [Gammaproteobacteria bacterium]|nr:hypothetical protein [Gammaproteobacteria bacterium]